MFNFKARELFAAELDEVAADDQKAEVLARFITYKLNANNEIVEITPAVAGEADEDVVELGFEATSGKVAYNANGQKLAVSIQNSLNNAIDRENNRVAKTIDNVYIIKHVEIPTTIVECGFLSNPEEEKLLLDDTYQDKLAWGIYNGIIGYFNTKSGSNS